MSKNEDWTIGLTSSFLALTTKKYSRWEEFREYLTGPFEALIEQYQPVLFTRIGLRYVDLIQRSKLGLGNVGWSDLLQPHIAAELTNSVMLDYLEQSNKTIVYRLEEHNSFVRIQHGLVRNKEGEMCYLIDSDFFTEEKTEIEDAHTLLNYFNQQGRHLFRWCITERLHKAMEPQYINQ
jgi:uncharacterized protein (TIGR04255 family)